MIPPEDRDMRFGIELMNVAVQRQNCYELYQGENDELFFTNQESREKTETKEYNPRTEFGMHKTI
jgi:hypothetical protein